MSNPGNDMLHFDNQTENYFFPCEEEESRFGPERFDRNRVVGMGVSNLITGNAARERTRVKTLRGAFLELQRTLPAVPPDTKLSKLDVLVLATTYIAHLMRTLNEDEDENQLFAAHGIMHPVKKWPMRSRLYAGILSSTYPVFKSTVSTEGNQEIPWQRKGHFVNNIDIQPKIPNRRTCSRGNFPETTHFNRDCQNS